MTNRQQWTMIAGVVTTAVFGVALAIKLRPQIELLEIGSTAPQFRATDLRTGRPAALADYRGTVVLLNIWATWCPPCRAEMPSMEKLYQRLHGNRSFVMLAVSQDTSDRTEVAAYVKKHGYHFDVLLDPKNSVAEAYKVTGVPETFIIDDAHSNGDEDAGQYGEGDMRNPLADFQ